VRELENAMERAVIMTTGEYVTLRELPRNLSDAQINDVPITADGEPALAGLSLDELERRAIMATLKECADNKSEAARRLGITRATLHNKLKRYGME
jgi:two-component system response regulator HydG